jgi:pre-mRNA-splicing factor CDC5/CEF1
MIKGGVWKNTEDEILKAAVMKYGKNQWDRIASLMPRKNSKQCKARWFEWLDPSIKKTEWTREEEEKLLHMAKLMPTQWRTIAPIVGRTAAQCLEHYEKLLDRAQGNDVDGAEDPRKLRPGEIDPSPETKPAKPDPVDMDADELEMLSEARARLANTRGKKAKRKAREKQMLEAKRLATLQKRRELRAAGLITGNKRRRTKKERQANFDFSSEIPFHKKAPSGFYDVSEEDERARKARKTDKFKVKRLAEVETRNRDAEERRARIKDKKRLETLKKMNLPKYIENVSKLNDPSATFRRSKLSLPKPQVSENEIFEIVKQGQKSSLTTTYSNDATQGLVADYEVGRTPSMLRTPSAMRTPAMQDVVMEEARNAILRNTESTPLLGGENVKLTQGTGFQGAMPTPSVQRTPSHLASMAGQTPLVTPMSTTSSSSSHAVQMTPLHDGLNINNADDLEEPAAKRARLSNLKVGLRGLPQPQYEYGVEVPDVVDEDEDEEKRNRDLEVDASEIQREKERFERARHAEEMRKRSNVLKRDLPRPIKVNRAMVPDGLENETEKMLARTTLKLVKYDSVKFPPVESSSTSSKKKKQRRVPQLEGFTETELSNARKLVESEARNGKEKINFDTFCEVWDRLLENRIFVPSRESYANISDLSKDELLQSLQSRYEDLMKQIQRDSTRALKLEKKVGIVYKGYTKVHEKLVQKIAQAQNEFDQSENQRVSFLQLMYVQHQ